MTDQWQATIASDLRYIRTRMAGLSWWWNVLELLLLVWIGLGVWTKAA
jgi:hypothetical protein